MPESTAELKRILSTTMVWGLGVGYVISGNYFGWNLGLEKGGTLGLAIAVTFAIIMYVTFTYSYAELACAIPKAGGAFDYASRSLGKDAGFITGMAQNIEFIFAPPAIAFAIGSYLNLYFPSVSVIWFSISAYLIFTALNIYGLKTAARVELLVTLVAVAGLLIFAASVAGTVKFENLALDSLPNGIPGIFEATPFAIWFFLGIEGVANLAEETINPRKTMSRGFLLTLFTLITACILTFISASGVGGWKTVVYQQDGLATDSPLPLAIQFVHGNDSLLYSIFIGLGLFGLVASFNGLMLSAGRSSSGFGGQMLKSDFLSRISPRFQTPANALVINMLIGILALVTGRTAEVITLSVFGALTLYCFSMISLVRLRSKEPDLDRPFKTPFYPFFPWIAFGIALTALTAVAVYNLILFTLYVMIIAVSYGIFKLRKSDR